MHNSTERAKIRKQLIDNGYRPLPLLDKGIRIPGWSRDDITQEWIDQFARSARYKNTGIRCDDLIAFDIDVLNEDLADDIEHHVEKTCGVTDLCRVGRWPKRLLVYRSTGDAERSARTGKYGGHQVELLATHGRQFAAFGTHPGTGADYEWLDGFSPLNTPFADLPELSPELALQCLGELEELLAATGLERTTPGGRRGVDGVNLYDLDDSSEMLLSDGSCMLWGDLKSDLDETGVWGNLRRENGEFGDSDGCHAYISKGLGQPCIYDFPRDVTHWDDPAAGSKALADALPDAPTGTTMFNGGDDLQELIDGYVLLADKTVRSIDHPEHIWTADGFALINAHKTVSAPTARNPVATVPAVAEWIRHDDTLRADKAALRPDRPDDVIVIDNGTRLFNTYVAPDLPQDGEIETFHEFVAHLVPDPEERALFLSWNAMKVAHPDWRLHALITTTRTQGTGRGVWRQILEKMFGAQYVNSIELREAFGDGSQSQFNDYMASSLILYIPEALEADRQRSRWESRNMAYERLKAWSDNASERMRIKRKYGHTTTERVYASLLISSNHEDAIVIEPNDRRVMVLENTKVRLVDAPDRLYERVIDWMDVPGNVGRARGWLKEYSYSADYHAFGPAPMTKAKARMISAGTSDLDHLYEVYRDAAAGDICTLAQWRGFVLQQKASGEFDLPSGTSLDNGIKAVLQAKACRIHDNPNWQLKVGSSKVRPWVVRNEDRWVGHTENSAVSAEIAKNGDPGGNVLKL